MRFCALLFFKKNTFFAVDLRRRHKGELDPSDLDDILVDPLDQGQDEDRGLGGRCLDLVKRRLPVTQWLPKYQPRQDLLPDIIAGLTVGLCNIPEGMSYAIIGNLQPQVTLIIREKT